MRAVLLVGPDQKVQAATLGLDLTLRDVQKRLKANGHPWEVGKVFPGSAIVGPWMALDQHPDYLSRHGSLHQHPHSLAMWLAVLRPEAEAPVLAACSTHLWHAHHRPFGATALHLIRYLSAWAQPCSRLPAMQVGVSAACVGQ